MSDTPAKGLMGGGGRSLTLLAGFLVLVLALGALLWPGGGPAEGRGVFLVFDSTGNGSRTAQVYEPLQNFLNEILGRPLDLVVVRDTGAFRAELSGSVEFVLCPDGLGLGLDAASFAPVVVGRRSAPRNLRPRGVLVYRKSAGLLDQPWISRPEATVCGDSVSLTATGSWRRKDAAQGSDPGAQGTCTWGPDPYDHAPALHAARLGGFDYALVRQWDADRFFADGLLSPLEWGVEIMTVPVPDIVMFASRSVSAKALLGVTDGLTALGRGQEDQRSSVKDLRLAVGGLNLAGFNLMVDPDFELVRRNFAGNWPGTDD